MGIGPKKSSEAIFHGAEGSGVAIVGSGLIGPLVVAWHAKQLYVFLCRVVNPRDHTISRSNFFHDSSLAYVRELYGFSLKCSWQNDTCSS